MATQMIGRAPATSRAGPADVVAWLGAAAFAASATWYTLAARGVTIAAAPRLEPPMPLPLREHIYYRWLVTTLPQERYYTAIAIAAFLCLAASAFFARDLLGRDRAPARIGAGLAGSGSLLWIAGSVLELGGHRAVGLMATHANPIQTTNSIAFTIDTISAGFALAAFALIGAGMLGFAMAARRTAHRTWARVTLAVALVTLVTAASYAAGNGGFSDLMLFVSGAVLLPLWLIWTGRALTEA